MKTGIKLLNQATVKKSHLKFTDSSDNTVSLLNRAETTIQTYSVC